MKAVQNEDKSWSVVDSEGRVRVTGLKNRAEARAKAKELTRDPVLATKSQKKSTKPSSDPEKVFETPAFENGELTVSALYELVNAVGDRVDSLTKELAPKGITSGQFAVLNALFPDKVLSQKDLCASVGCSGGNMTMLIDNLERANFVERNQDSVDRRRILVRLTEEGAILAEQAAESDSRIVNHLFAPIFGMDKEKVKVFAEVLATLVTTLD